MRSHQRLLGRFGTACLLLLVGAVAGDAASLTEAQLRDGLSRLAGLLAADVPKTARWVLVTSERGRVGIFGSQDDVFQAQGNVFLLDEKAGVEGRIMTMYDGTIYSVKAQQRDRSDENRGNWNELYGQWKDADPAKDAAAAVEWLRAETNRMGKGQAQGPGSGASNAALMHDGEDSAQRLAGHQQTALFWAAMLAHTGHEPPALALAAAAFDGTDERSRKLLLDAFFNRLGERAYARVLQNLRKHHDWAKFRDELAGVINRFPQGWHNRDAARVLLHKVTERARLPAVPPLAARAAQLTSEEQKTLLAWLKDLEEGRSDEGLQTLWTLPPGPQDESEEDEGERDSSMTPAKAEAGATPFPRSLGLAAVPLLAALLADETLTLAGFSDDGEDGMDSLRGFSHTFYGGRDMEPADALRQAYSNLSKPPTRAEVVKGLLAVVLPNELQNDSSEEAAQSIPDILAWHATVKDLPAAEVALAYLEGGNQDPAVLAHAMKLDDPKKLARLEGVMVEQAAIWNLERLVPFVEKLGPARAPAFISQVRQHLEADLARYSNDADGMRKRMDSGLKRLEAASRGEKKNLDLPAILALFAAFDPQSPDNEMEVSEAYQAFPKAAKKLPQAARAEMIVNALPGFKSPAFASQILRVMFGGHRQAQPLELKAEERAPLLAATKASWEKLLATGADSAQDDNGERLGLLVSVVEALQTLAAAPSSLPWQDVAQLGSPGTKLLSDHAHALLAGQQASLPDPADVGNDEQEKLLAEWGAKPPAEIAAGLASLDIARLLALNQKITRALEIPAGMQAHIITIHEVKVKQGTDPAPWQAWKGRSFTLEQVAALARQIAEHQAEGVLGVTLMRRAPLMGFTLMVQETPKLGGGWQAGHLTSAVRNVSEDKLKTPQRVAVAIFQQARTQARFSWLGAPTFASPKTNPSPAPDNDDAENARNWAALETCMAEHSVLPASLFLVSAPVALVKAQITE